MKKKNPTPVSQEYKKLFLKIHQVSETTVRYICQKGKKSNANGINLKRTENARKVLLGHQINSMTMEKGIKGGKM